MVLTSTSAAATASANPPLSNAQNRVATPTRVPRSTSRAALSELRATTVMSVTPSSASPTTAAGAVPPDPSTSACPAAAPNAPATPSMSVLSARQPCGVRTRVLAEPTRSARAVRSSANRRAANLPGMVTETPTHSGPKPPTTTGNSAAPHSMRS
ncbi:Uncharacterised protein [Mycobacterium tuberculosis]|nr:Uncharacterised protein [Mycobacterium tuberculosis]CNZ02803.1 Uncharacterised protein [Mycobacterium tuberculosis]COU66923.1 Uncharacterised protein [Mycobacterium tuberculosis]